MAAKAVAAHDYRLRATLDALPGFLAQSHRTADRLTGFAAAATPVMRDLRLATLDLVPAVRDLRPAARAGRATVGELGRFARVALPTMQQLTPFARAARRFVPPLEGFLRQTNPLLGYLEPYWRELTTFFADAGAATQATDEIGHVARVLLPVSRSNLPATVPPQLEQTLKDASGDLDTRGSNPFPKPGDAGNSKPLDRDYPRLEPDPPYGR